MRPGLSRVLGLQDEGSESESAQPPRDRQGRREAGEPLASLTPRRGRVILEAAETPEKVGRFYTATYVQYPQAAWIVALGEGCREDLRLGDLALVEVQSIDVEAVYPEVFKVFLRDETRVEVELVCSVEIEPIVREVVEAYRTAPTAKNYRIRVETVDKGQWQFDASDVLTYGLCHRSTPSWHTLVPENVKMFGLWFGVEPSLFYEVDETYILGVIRDE